MKHGGLPDEAESGGRRPKFLVSRARPNHRYCTPVAGLAGAVLSQAPNERRQAGQMSGRDLHGGGQVLEAIRLDGPRRVIGEDVTDPGLLGTGEHGAAMVAEREGLGQARPSSLPGLRRTCARSEA